MEEDLDVLLKMHPHPMVSCDIEGSTSKCSICGDDQIEGSAYRCTECVSVVHKLCAEFSIQYNQLKKHEHPWVEIECSIRDEQHSPECCHLCSRRVEGGSAYGCEKCKYYMHKSCVESLSFRAIRKRCDDTGIYHFLHEHLLAPSEMKRFNYYECGICQLNITYRALVYGCAECQYYLHNSCAEYSFNPLQHPLHPHHLLIPLVGDYSCQGCCQSGYGSVGCEPCNFRLHIDCVSLEPSLKFQYRDHPFYLIENRVKHRAAIGCCTCGDSSDDMIFKCMHPGCEDYFHAHCVPFAVPKTVKHSCHYDALTFVESSVEEDGTDEHYCDICEMDRDVRTPVYRCSESKCDLTAHTACALSEVLPSLIAEWEISSAKRQAHVIREIELEQARREITKRMDYIKADERQFSHTLVEAIRQLNLAEEIHSKYVLQLQSEGDGGINRQFAHLNLSELPQQIEHPFHPPHPLTLYLIEKLDNPIAYIKGLHKCSWCQKMFTERSLYRCDDCKYVLHTECSTMSPPLRIRIPDHLLFAYEKPGHFLDDCSACEQKFDGSDSNSPAFICVVPGCSYTLHIHCLPFPLPEKYNHKYHSYHDLVYTNPGEIEGENSDECYCDDTDCEQLRSRNYPCYYCKECDYSVHIACCISEMLPSLIEQYEKDLLARGISLDIFLPKFEQDILDHRERKEGVEALLLKTRQELEELRQELARIKTTNVIV